MIAGVLLICLAGVSTVVATHSASELLAMVPDRWVIVALPYLDSKHLDPMAANQSPIVDRIITTKFSVDDQGRFVEAMAKVIANGQAKDTSIAVSLIARWVLYNENRGVLQPQTPIIEPDGSISWPSSASRWVAYTIASMPARGTVLVRIARMHIEAGNQIDLSRAKHSIRTVVMFPGFEAASADLEAARSFIEASGSSLLPREVICTMVPHPAVMSDAERWPILLSMLKSPQPLARQSACNALWRMGAPAEPALSHLHKLALEDPDEWVRKAAFTAEQEIKAQLAKPTP